MDDVQSSFVLFSSLEDLNKDCLGFAEDVYEHVLVSVSRVRVERLLLRI